MQSTKVPREPILIPYSGKFSYGANFRIFRMKPRDTKIKTTKILIVEILMSNFERAIEHVEAASKQWGFNNGISSLRTAFQTPVDPSIPVSLLR